MRGTRERRFDAAPEGTISEIVPERAVLTELARGFLLVHQADPDRAKRFAQTFLREQTGSGGSLRPPPPGRFAIVRRGITPPASERT
ncbi:MAG: hypothetical protein L3K19_06790 [Thermoplasmata archaeon]|nr:hypothetical protein [Thermoplasmata archaeon]